MLIVIVIVIVIHGTILRDHPAEQVLPQDHHLPS